MEVRCERCRAQYVFDDAQVTEAGLTVQCSSCGHVFKVKKKALVVTVPVTPDEAEAAQPVFAAEAAKATHPSEAPAAIPEKVREWRLRQASGNVFTFKELTTLQKWIVERKVARDDEISLSGDQWKRLGDIGELATFFQVVEAAERGQAHAAAPAVTPVPVAVYPVTGAYPLPYPPGSAPVFSGQPAYPVTMPPGVPGGAGGSAPHAPIPGSAADGSAAWEGEPAAPPKAAAAEPAWTSERRPPRVGRDFDDEDRRPRRRGRGTRTVVLLLAVVTVLGGGAAAVAVLKPEWIDWAGLPMPASVGKPAATTAARPEPVPPAPQPPPPAPPVATSPAPVASAAPAAPMPPPAPPPASTLAPATPSAQTNGIAPGVEPKSPAASAPVSNAKPAADEPKPAPSASPGAPPPAESRVEGARAAASPVTAPEQHAERKPAAPSRTAPEKTARAPRGVKSLLTEAKRLRDQGKTERALDLYGEVAEKEPENPEALAGRGWCYLDLSQYSPAEASFQAALDQDPRSPEALMGLAETFRYEGHKAEAVKFYERYLAAHPEGEDAVAARNAISQLKE